MESLRMLALIAGVGLVLLNGSQSPQSRPPKDVTFAKPADEWLPVVADMQTVAMQDREAAGLLAQFYAQSADFLRRDKSTIETTDQLLAWLNDADTLRIQGTDLVGALKGHGDARQKVMEHAGATSAGKRLEAADKRRIAEAFDAIAWALAGDS